MAKKKTAVEESPILPLNQTIVIQKLSALKPNEKNKAIYPEEDIEDLKESIKTKGILVPLVVRSDGLIISGHRRYKAAQALEIEEVNTIIENIPDEEVEFRMIQYNVYRRKKYSEILNEIDRLYDYYGRNQGKRTDIIEAEKLDVFGQIAKTVGLSTGNMSYLLKIRKINYKYIERIDNGDTSISKAYERCKSAVKSEIDKDAIYTPVPMFTDDYQLYNKSCENMSEIKDNSIQLVLTSPPYWHLRDYKGGRRELGQEEDVDDYVKNLFKVLKDCYRVLKPKGSFFLNIGDTREEGITMNVPQKVLFKLLKEQEYFHIQTIIWAKTNARPVQNYRMLQPTYEYIFHLTKSKDYTFNENIARSFLLFYQPHHLKQLDKHPSERKKAFHPVFGEKQPFGLENLYDFWSQPDFLKTSSFQPIYEAIDESDVHPAPMNTIVPILPILLTCKEGDTVLDCFSGSATTGIVALYYGMKYRGYEISKQYSEAAGRRLAKFLGLDKRETQKEPSK